MPLDIVIDGGSDKAFDKFYFGLDDYYDILEKLEHGNYPILKRVVVDYYSDSEVYINELSSFKSEVETIKQLFDAPDFNPTVLFLNNFLKLIESAVAQRKTIKFIAD